MITPTDYVEPLLGPPQEPCPICHAMKFAPAVFAGTVAVWKCVGCGIGRTFPLPLESDGHECFAEDTVHILQAYVQPKDRWWHRFNEAPLRLLKAAGAKPGSRILDVGCNLGYFLTAAVKEGYVVRGIDGSAVAVAVGQSLGLDLICSRIEEATVAPASQDIIVLNHVLEHLPNPRQVLSRLHDWLKPEGILLITLPNFASPVARLSGIRWAGLVPSQHIWHFTPLALITLVEDSGFSHIMWRTGMLKYSPVGINEWVKWIARWMLERVNMADNLLLVARRCSEDGGSLRK